jgi:hypothetical protein
MPVIVDGVADSPRPATHTTFAGVFNAALTQSVLVRALLGVVLSPV